MTRKQRPDELTKTNLRWLERIRAAGYLRFERTETGDEHFFLDNGKTVQWPQVHVLQDRGLLVPIGDGLFSGVTQSFVAR